MAEQSGDRVDLLSRLNRLEKIIFHTSDKRKDYLQRKFHQNYDNTMLGLAKIHQPHYIVTGISHVPTFLLEFPEIEIKICFQRLHEL